MKRTAPPVTRLLVLAALAVPLLLLLAIALVPPSVARGKSAARPLTDLLEPADQRAQELALADPRIRAMTTGRRSEVMGVVPVGAQVTPASRGCLASECRQVNLYDLDGDASIVAIVDLDRELVLDVLHQPGVRPGINRRLADRALEIAFSAPELIEVLGYRPTGADWPPMDADLLNTHCDDRHFCVAPTFDLGDYILWAFVDLTTGEFVDLAWTPSRPFDPARSTLFVPQGCPPPGSVSRAGWTLDYETTPSDGFRVYNVRYNGDPVLTSGKLAEWHADYGSTGFRDSTGCGGGGGGGFPIYPSGSTAVDDLLDSQNNVVGFELVQDFRMDNWGNSCHYRYEQHFQFFDDGRWRAVAGAYGRGCGNNSIYRPLVALDIAVNGDDGDSFSHWDGTSWVGDTTEIKLSPRAPTDSNGYAYRISDAGGTTYYVEPGRGQFGNAEREGDDEFVYVVRHDPSEIDVDLGVIGACCDDNNHGPEQFVDGESIDGENLVLWYVPQMVTRVAPGDYYCWTVSGEPSPETYPCFAGPMFIPTSAQSAPSASFTHDAPVGIGGTVNFDSTIYGSTPITTSWSFGDGSSSSDPDPSHRYDAAGRYSVVLTATNPYGSHVISDTVEVIAPPRADFAVATSPLVGRPVQFTNLTASQVPPSFLWRFGDGATSTDPDPSHIYSAPGRYTVELNASSPYGFGATQREIEVMVPLWLPLISGR